MIPTVLWVLLVGTAVGQLQRELCVTDSQLAERTLLVLPGPSAAAAMYAWWQQEQRGSIFVSTITPAGAMLGWFDANRSAIEIPAMPAGSSLYLSQVSAEETRAMCERFAADYTTCSLVRFFASLKAGVVKGSTPPSVKMEQIRQRQANESAGPLTAAPVKQLQYKGDDLTGLVVVNAYQLNAVDSPGYVWDQQDVQQSETAVLQSTLAISAIGAVHFCKQVTWLVRISPHDSEESKIRNISEVSPYEFRSRWLPQLMARENVSNPALLHMLFGLKWRGILLDSSSTSSTSTYGKQEAMRLGTSASRVVSVFLISQKVPEAACGVEGQTGYGTSHVVLMTSVHKKKQGCGHWLPQTLAMHELLHAFGACDEYGECDCGCWASWCSNITGYACFNNLNCFNCQWRSSNTKKHRTLRCVMVRGMKSLCMCAATAMQVGWGHNHNRSLPDSAARCSRVALPTLSDDSLTVSGRAQGAVTLLLCAVALAVGSH